MCGIFGYSGNKKNADQVVVNDLKRLDYRGYDSWGVGIAADNNLYIQKQVGKISDIPLPLRNAKLGLEIG